jgi:hypothetical protein
MHVDRVDQRRKHLRINIAWPVVVITPNGILDGETQNLSLGGASLRCGQVPDLNDSFRVVLKPSGRKLLLATAEIIWSDICIDKTTSCAIGVRFTFMLDDDRQFISDTISNLS